MTDRQPNPGRIPCLDGFADLAGRYDGVVLDLWGVVHDGEAPYPGVLDCLARLRDAGKRVVLLSNAPRRAAPAQVRLRELGVGDDLYTGIMTSGEASFLALRDRTDPWFAGLGRSMFHIGPERDRSVFDTLPFEQAGSPDRADWVLNTGPDDQGDPSDLSYYDPLLRSCLDAGLPMLCANPDLEVMRGKHRLLCAGSLAQRYEALGGHMRLLGKPDAAIYAPVLAMLDMPASRVIAVGDSLRTDIAGAQAAGLASCWVLGGIHSHEADPGAVAAAHGLAPAAMLPRFTWS